MDDVKNNNKLNILLKIGVITLFVILSIFVANGHEHWSDEAQSFLLARDNSFIEIFEYIRYEGTPALWVLIVKFFLLMGGTYELFYILPIIFSTLGIIIFEFKIEAPLYIKILLPFTYFIFFQYTIVARSYCLVFPLLMLIASIYDKKLEKPILYSVVLFVFMNISLHTLVLTGSLYILYLIELYKKSKNKKQMIAAVIIFLELLTTTLYIVPKQDCTFNGNGGATIFQIISDATIGNYSNFIIEAVVTIMVIAVITISLKDELKSFIKLVVFMLPVITVLNVITYQVWHVGIITLALFTYLIMTKMIDKKLIKCMTYFIILIQIYWTVSSTYYDLNNKYSAAEEVANFIKINNYQEYSLYGLGYSSTAIEPYFKTNILDNRNTDKSFYFWKENNGYYTEEERITNMADVYVISDLYKWHYTKEIEILNESDYKKYEFKGGTFVKNKKYEPEGFIIYVKNKLEKENI